mgnify:CR=1 FL=1
MDVGALAALLDQSHDAIFAWECPGGIVIWNHSAELMYGYSSAEALGHRPTILLHTEQLIPTSPSFVFSLEQTGSWEGELEHTDRSGRKIIVDSRMRLVNIGGKHCVLESNRDITGRKQNEMLLRKDNTRLRLLSEIAELLLAAEHPEEMMQEVYSKIATDLQLDGYVFYATGADGRSLELRSSTGILGGAYPSCSRVEFGEAICGAVAANRTPLLATDIQNTDHPRLEAVRQLGFRTYACYPLLNGSELLGTLSLGSRKKERFDSEDIEFIQTVTRYVVLAKVRLRNEFALEQSKEQLRSAKRQLEGYTRTLEMRVAERTESLQHTVRSLEELLYTIAHDLRAPNRALSGFAEILLEDYASILPSEGVELLQRIAGAAVHNDDLIRDLLELGQLAHRDFTCRKLNLGAIVRRSLETLDPDLSEAKATVNVSFAEQWPDVWANESVLGEITMELILNAVKFNTPGRTPEINISFEASEREVHLRIQDRGIGIATAHQEIIFQPFQRLHPGRAPEGTGIGLAIVQQAARRLGGNAGVISDGPGTGSCFWIKLIKSSEPNPCAPPSARAAAQVESF